MVASFIMPCLILAALATEGSIVVAGHVWPSIAISRPMQTIEIAVIALIVIASIAFLPALRYASHPCDTQFLTSIK